MKRWLASFALIAVVAALSGCYYDPGYSYVRGSSHSGDVYYGDAGNAYYVAPAYGYGYGYYGNGYYGCCYAPSVSIGVSRGWYGGSRYGYYHGRAEGRADYRRGYGHADQGRGHSDRGRERHNSRGDAPRHAYRHDHQ